MDTILLKEICFKLYEKVFAFWQFLSGKWEEKKQKRVVKKIRKLPKLMDPQMTIQHWWHLIFNNISLFSSC